MLLEFQSTTNIEIIWVLIDDFGFALDSSDTDLQNIKLLDTYLFRFFRYRYPHFFVSKTSWGFREDMSSGRLEDLFWRHLQGMSSRCLEDMCSRHLEGVFSVTNFRLPRHQKLLRWRRVGDTRRLQDQQMFAGLMHLLICFAKSQLWYMQRNSRKILEHIVTDVHIFMLLYLESRRDTAAEKEYWNTDNTGARSSSEVQENRNRRIK